MIKYLFLLVAVSFLDFQSTVLMLGSGGQELNSMHNAIIENFGYMTFFIFRVIFMPLVIFLLPLYHVFEEYRVWIYRIFIFVYASASIFNFLQYFLMGT